MHSKLICKVNEQHSWGPLLKKSVTHRQTVQTRRIEDTDRAWE